MVKGETISDKLEPSEEPSQVELVNDNMKTNQCAVDMVPLDMEVFEENEQHNEMIIKQEPDDEPETDYIQTENPQTQEFHFDSMSSSNECSNEFDPTLLASTCLMSFEENIKIEPTKMHTAEKTFSCQLCGKALKTSNTLKIHMQTTHARTAGEKPYACEICHKRFTIKHNLKHHMRFHSDDRPFSCVICHKKFEDDSKLKAHDIRAHTGEKLFQCEVCAKNMDTASSLKRHMVSHSTERPYSCEKCEKTYKKKYYLNVHVRKVHLEKKSEITNEEPGSPVQ